jgi:hypothetical protein
MTRPETRELKEMGVNFTTYSDTYKKQKTRRITIELRRDSPMGKKILTSHGYKQVKATIRGFPFYQGSLKGKMNPNKFYKNVPKRKKK